MRQWWMSPAASIMLFAAFGCASAPARAPVAHTPDLQSRLAAANALLRVGCFDCLTDAFREYDAVRTTARADAATVDAATAGAVRSALLLDLRERELGMSDDGYLARARTLLADHDALLTQLSPPLDMIGAMAWRGVVDDAQLAAMMRLASNRDAWHALFRAHAGESEFSAYLWLTVACATGESARLMQTAPDDLTAPFAAFRDAPLVAYKMATCVGPRPPGRAPAAMDADAIVDVARREPRFVEVGYLAGVRSITLGHLEDADADLRRVYAWHPRWPAVTLALASVALTAEDFDGALDFYQKTLELSPAYHDALFGRLRALSYLTRYEDAIQAADAMLQGPWYRGEALYWRAWNDMQLDRNDQAWTDIQSASKLLITADVAKLAGIIAYRRHELDVSRAKFEEGRKMNGDDCETGFYLGLVNAELKLWQPTVDVFVTAASCLERSRQQITQETATIQASNTPPERKAQKIARRERQLVIETRRLATSWFNTAVGYFNLSQNTQARQYAEKVSDDEQFGERARELLSRLVK
jgi:tetratricopeptide (TPR) repeat protein